MLFLSCATLRKQQSSSQSKLIYQVHKEMFVYDTALKICADYCWQSTEVYLSLKSGSTMLETSPTLHSVLLSNVEIQ